MTLGQKLQQLRKRDGLSQEALAEQVAVTRQTISKWELDQSMPDLNLIARLSDIFQVSTDYLIKPELTQPGALPTPQKKRHLPDNIRSTIFVLLTGAALTAICICLICDYFTTGMLSWSWIATASIVSAWLVLLPSLTAKRGIVWKTLVISSIVPFFLLAIIALCLEWPLIFTMGSCIALLGVAAGWLIYGIFRLCKRRLWCGFGLALLVMIPLSIAILLVIAQAIPQAQISFDSSLFNSALTFALSLGCFGMDAFTGQKRPPKA